MYTEKDAARIFKQLLGAVNYLHAHGVCHRDIKPENILFSTIDEESPLKLIDFGLSKIFNGDDNTMKGIVGTTFYMAPEVLTGKYNEKCDVWACGVILYIMLCGKPPFYSKDENELRHKICEMKYDFNFQEFQNVSEEAKDLIKSILVSKEIRPSIQEVLEHKWIKENAPNSTNKVLNIDWFHIKKYSQLNLMQKCVINFTAFHLTEDETRQFVEMFNSLDENNDGVLTIEEIQNGIEKCQFGMKINTDDMIEMFNEMDVDKNGLINFTEFISALMDYEKYIKKEQLLECFKSYDTDGSGTISFEEFCDMIKPQDEEEKKKLFDLYKKYDENNDGEIDFNEFVDGFLKEL
jgi:calcium-dependent protein kinase